MVTQVTTELFSNKTVLLNANNNSYYFWHELSPVIDESGKNTQPSKHCRDAGKISTPVKRTLQKHNPPLLCRNATDFALSFAVQRKKKSGLVKSMGALLYTIDFRKSSILTNLQHVIKICSW